jgi:ribosome-associated translation inhibitor RaiA
MIPYNLISRDFPVSEANRFELEKHMLRLERICDKITSCDIVLSLPHKHGHKGRIFHLNLKLHVPGEVLVINREPELNADHEDFHLSVRDAFKALRRRLEEYVSRQKGMIKQHERDIMSRS